MPSSKTDYAPINCDYYDHIEIYAMRRLWLLIEYDEGADKSEIVTRITTTKTQEKEEYIVTESGLEIRMDKITLITPLSPHTDLRGHLLHRLDFNLWANKTVIKHLLLLPEIPDSVGSNISHNFNAQDAWNRRIHQMNSRFDIWEDHPKENWLSINKELHQQSYELLQTGQLDRFISYTNFAGESHQSSICDIIYHIINHSTYHRGQIALILKESGQSAVATDYIIFSRK